ncbi:hypothetical protein [Eikenella corrodens]|uniref:hypothetical protein n=1 Tax=Eikenella corrodens TaxID=539 RepID=UPI00129BBC89|nr:hypothetical protein [Eikenella corrodens]
MSRPKKRTETGRLTREAAAIVIEMLKEGVIQGKLCQADWCELDPEFYHGAPDARCHCRIGNLWYTETLTYHPSGEDHRDIIGFTKKPDRKEFKRRWNERYPKEAKPETQVETHSESETELTYPLFAKSKKNGAINLFTSKTTGVCVKPRWSFHAPGEYHNNWAHATDTKCWQHLTFAEAEAEIFGEKK